MKISQFLRFAAILMGLPAYSEDLQILEYRDNFLEIEVTAKQVKFDCDAGKSDEEVDWWSLETMGQDLRFSFICRRGFPGACPEKRAEFKKVVAEGGRVRIAGIQPDIHIWKELLGIRQPHKDMRKMGRTISAVFGRISSTRHCFSYFVNDCKSEEYWLGVIPGKKIAPFWR